MFGKLTSEEIEMFLGSHFIARIGCHANNITYVVPIGYAYDGRFFYSRTFPGMKIDMMRTNPRVCIQVDDTRDLANWKSVIAWGDFEELHGEEKSAALRKLVTRTLPVKQAKPCTLPINGHSPTMTCRKSRELYSV